MVNTSFHLKDGLSIAQHCQENIHINLLTSAYQRNQAIITYFLHFVLLFLVLHTWLHRSSTVIPNNTVQIGTIFVQFIVCSFTWESSKYLPLDGHPECHPAYYKRSKRIQSTETTSFRAYISQHIVATQWAKLSQMDAQLEISEAGLLKINFNSVSNACGIFALLPLLSIYYSLFMEICITLYKQLKKIKKYHTCRSIEIILMLYFSLSLI